MHGKFIPVNASIEMLENLSAHADALEITTWLKESNINPLKVFITHGERSGSLALKGKLEKEFG